MTSSLTDQSTPPQTSPQQPTFFGKEQAANYDQRWVKVAAIREALQLLLRIRFSELPADAHILCVGVGTGTELLYLASEFPGWSFTAVEPSAPMLDLCRERVEAAGLTARCTFHEGYLDSLPATPPADAATCLLVSQFITQPEARRDFFALIASRLRPGGTLVSADLATGAAATYPDLFELWLDMQRFCDAPESSIEHLRTALGRDVAVTPPHEIEALLMEAGFDAPTQFFQALLIHGWYSRRAA